MNLQLNPPNGKYLVKGGVGWSFHPTEIPVVLLTVMSCQNRTHSFNDSCRKVFLYSTCHIVGSSKYHYVDHDGQQKHMCKTSVCVHHVLRVVCVQDIHLVLSFFSVSMSDPGVKLKQTKKVRP